MAGFIYSQRQFEMYRFLERVGPCPLPALEILFGRKTHAALKALRWANYVYDIVLNEIVFWSPQGYGHFNPKKQELMAWFIVRLEEGEGKYLGDGLCVTPNGTKMLLHSREGFMLVVDEQNRKMAASLNDLNLKKLSDCLKWSEEL